MRRLRIEVRVCGAGGGLNRFSGDAAVLGDEFFFIFYLKIMDGGVL